MISQFNPAARKHLNSEDDAFIINEIRLDIFSEQQLNYYWLIRQ
jgi:hypothetical protein